ncbi:adhesion G protein-coupled receptor F5-like isoform X3 [Trachinotus anak]|uniref:adhesion G protein-coupled receptor F5-like isoform X3 n=1 Tax=Trachinotus anak TaxID=443729 RepID=UPI0039F1C1A8
MRVGMALPKAVGYMIVLLAICYTLENQGYRQSLNVFFEDLMSTKASYSHAREKRAAALNSSDYVLEAVINVSDLDRFRTILSQLTLTLLINNTVEITSIETTTVCSSNASRYQCRCEENYAWSFNNCIISGACDAIVGGTCGCIDDLPADGQFCQLNTSIPETTPSPTPPHGIVDIDLVLDLRIPASSVPSNFIDQARNSLSLIPFFFPITESLIVTSLNVTTVCYPYLVGGLQCQCEEGFAWPCDKCDINSSCSNGTTEICTCRNGLPPDGEFCEPITNTSLCPTPTPETTPSPTPPNETTPSPTPPHGIVDIDLVLDLRIPASSVPSNFIDQARNSLSLIPFFFPITESLIVTSLNVTTVCYPYLVGGLQCQCEEGFAWPCDKCDINSSCSNGTTEICTCRNGLPPDGEFCEPITNTSLCPTPTPETTPSPTPPNVTTTTEMTTTTTEITTTPMTTTTTEITTTPMTTTTTSMTTTVPPIIRERSFSITMDLTFDDAYNDQNSAVFQNINNAIQTQSRRVISTLVSASEPRFRSGSTIADYTIRAAAFPDSEIEELEAGVFTQLSEIYTMIYDSPTSLVFVQPFLGQRATLTCGPPPPLFNFGDSWTAEWTRNDELILEDSEHSFSRDGERAILTVSKFFVTDRGRYECRLRDKSIFRQRSDGFLSPKEIPLIQISPIRNKVKCEVGKEVPLQCSVNSPYTVEFPGIPSVAAGSKIDFSFRIPDNCANQEEKFTCQVVNLSDFKREIILELSTDDFDCVDDIYGAGNVDDIGKTSCDQDEVGEKTAVCRANGEWEPTEDNCILRPIQELLNQSQSLTNSSLPAFLDQLSSVTLNFSQEVVESPANINAIVEILSNVANTTRSSNIIITQTVMEDVLLVAGVLTTEGARNSWENLNTRSTGNSSVTRSNIPEARSASSSFLQSVEIITTNLNNDSFDIVTDFILLNKTTFTDTFSDDFNSSVEIDIPEADGGNKSLTVITFSSMDNVLPARDEDNATSNVINGRVVLVQSSGTIDNISFTFDVINNTLGNPQCVFWNFSLFNGLGGWDDEGCEVIISVNETISCSCNHLTSFSILMSPFAPDDPILDFITYIGVGISIASLVICLIIEAVIWRKIRRNNTSYLRHVSIVNIAVSLLIANIWFIIGAAISDADTENQPACSAATFFIHFFYLALFFWMLASALLLLYRTVSVFDGGLSKKSMLAIGFTVGYGAPLIIAIITVAVTEPNGQYIRLTGVCWLNWGESKALLAFVIPALVIVVINLCILIVVIFKMLRRRAVRDAAHAAERHVLVVIARSLAVLTPFFGLTWALGVGTMTNPQNRGIHISFAFFNSLQGFFILVFGTLLDKKVRSEIAIKSQTSSGGTRSTSAGTSSSSGLGFLRNWRRGRDGYNVSSNDTSASQSFGNT